MISSVSLLLSLLIFFVLFFIFSLVVMACSHGAKNYKKVVLLEVEKEVLPTGAYKWEQVANL